MTIWKKMLRKAPPSKHFVHDDPFNMFVLPLLKRFIWYNQQILVVLVFEGDLIRMKFLAPQQEFYLLVEQNLSIKFWRLFGTLSVFVLCARCPPPVDNISLLVTLSWTVNATSHYPLQIYNGQFKLYYKSFMRTTVKIDTARGYGD